MFLTSRLQNNLNVKHGHHLTLNSTRKDTHDRDLIGVTRDIHSYVKILYISLDYTFRVISYINYLYHLKVT